MDKKASILLTLIIIVAALYRLDFLYALDFRIDSDEAIVGLMAKHLTEGSAFPVFYYGQHYMGSFEPWVASIFFELFGISAISLKLVPFCFSLLLIPVVFLLGKECGGNNTGLISAMYIACAPPVLAVWSSMARGGFIETVLLSALALLVFVRWLQDSKPSLLRIFILGLIAGFGWWTNNQIIYVMCATGWIGLGRLLSEKKAFQHIFSHTIVGLCAFFIGSIPFWMYNFENDFASFGIFSFSGDVLSHLAGVFTTALPVLFGAKRYWETKDFFPLSTLIIFVLYGGMLLFYFKSRGLSFLRALSLKVKERAGIEVMSVMFLFSILIFSLSSFGYLAQAPRYLLPLYVPISVLIAWVLTHCISERLVKSGLFVIIFFLNICFAYGKGRTLPGPELVYEGERVAHNHDELISVLNEKQISWIRTNYWIGYRLAFETKENVKFLVFGKPKQVRIPKYVEAFYKEHSSSDYVPLLTVPKEAAVVKTAFDAQGLRYKVRRIKNYELIYEIENKFPKAVYLDVQSYALQASDSEESLVNTADDDLSTRWGSGRAQTKDMHITASFPHPRNISGVSFDLGNFFHDYPRGFDIDVYDSDGKRHHVLKNKEYQAMKYHMAQGGAFTFRWPAINTSRIVLRQTGKDPVFDWSIAELRIIE